MDSLDVADLKLHNYDKTKVVVVDIGHKYTKIGFAGEHNPRFIFTTLLFDTCTKTNKAESEEQRDAELCDKVVALFHGIYFKSLLVNPKETKVVLVESLLCPSELRKTIAQVLFNHLRVPAVLFAPSHMVALYPLVQPTALSVDLGFEETLVIPVYHGYPVLNAYQVAPIGGRAVEREIRKLLEAYFIQKEPSRVPEVQNLPDETIEDIKITLCFVPPMSKVSRPDKESTRPPDVSYKLPGSHPLLIPGSLREDACEILFRPEDGVCLPTMLLDAILKCPTDMRLPLSDGVLLFGGTAMLPGLKYRLVEEVSELLKNNKYADKLSFEKLKVYKPPCADNFTAWLGGSLLGATETVNSRGTTREQYVEDADIPDWANLKYNVKQELTSRLRKINL